MVHAAECTHVFSDLPPNWAQLLIDATCQIHSEASLFEAMSDMVNAAATLLPGYDFGICVLSSDPLVVTSRMRDSGVNKITNHDEGDATRLFPDQKFETCKTVANVIRVHIGSSSDNIPTDFNSFLHAFIQLTHKMYQERLMFEVVQNRGIEIRRLQTQIIQTEKLASLGEIAAGIVHELNNPLTTILAYSDYLRKKVELAGTNAADIERIGKIHDAAERIAQFSRDLISYSRPSIEAPTFVDIEQILERAISFCEHKLRANGICVERHFDPSPPIRGIPVQLTQVFVNLLTNAIQAMRDRGGRITVSIMSTAANRTRVVIEDEGHGISNDALPHIFNPFYTTKSENEGTGLGLSIVKNIVNGHNGLIEAKNGMNGGALFTIDLPYAE